MSAARTTEGEAPVLARLVRARIEDMLTGRESNFERLAGDVLKKNGELYQRLA